MARLVKYFICLGTYSRLTTHALTCKQVFWCRHCHNAAKDDSEQVGELVVSAAFVLIALVFGEYVATCLLV